MALPADFTSGAMDRVPAAIDAMRSALDGVGAMRHGVLPVCGDCR